MDSESRPSILFNFHSNQLTSSYYSIHSSIQNTDEKLNQQKVKQKKQHSCILWMASTELFINSTQAEPSTPVSALTQPLSSSLPWTTTTTQRLPIYHLSFIIQSMYLVSTLTQPRLQCLPAIAYISSQLIIDKAKVCSSLQNYRRRTAPARVSVGRLISSSILEFAFVLAVKRSTFGLASAPLHHINSSLFYCWKLLLHSAIHLLADRKNVKMPCVE